MLRPFLLGSLALCTSLFLSFVNAADICTYTSRSCIGSFGCCYNIPAGTCCQWLGTSYGWSVRFQNMPAGWFGTTYGDLCYTSTSGIGGSGSSGCSSVWNGPTYSNWQSASWTIQSAAPRSAKFDTRAVQNVTACAVPDVVGFATPDGHVHLVKVPEGQFAVISELLSADNYEELLKLERAD